MIGISVINYFLVLLLSLMSACGSIFSVEQPSEFKIAILGLGGRGQYVLLECLKLNKNIHVMAVADNDAIDSLSFFLNKLQQRKNVLLDAYKNSFKDVALYPDTKEGLKQLFENHKDINMVFITSANYHHLRHLNDAIAYSSCKNIYMEKPIFKDLEEYNSFTLPDKDAHILIGLTLRYSTMTKIVVQKLQEYKNQLGALKQVRAWERLRFCQGLTSFMMSWRRYISLSGGLLLEKSIHDLDLALFFIHSLGVDLQEIVVTTESAHNCFKQSQKDKMLQEILYNDELKPTLIGRELAQFQRIVPFSFDQKKNIDWPTTMDAIFKGLPDNDNFDNVDIISDYHKLNATLKMSSGSPIDFELEVDLGGFKPKTERGMKFIFEHGDITIDVMKSDMKISLDGAIYEFDLQTNNSDHADGDEYIAQSILGTLLKEQYIATLNDPIVQLATMMGLISEQQSLLKDNKEIVLRKIGNHWDVNSDLHVN